MIQTRSQAIGHVAGPSICRPLEPAGAEGRRSRDNGVHGESTRVRVGFHPSFPVQSGLLWQPHGTPDRGDCPASQRRPGVLSVQGCAGTVLSVPPAWTAGRRTARRTARRSDRCVVHVAHGRRRRGAGLPTFTVCARTLPDLKGREACLG